ncbi:diaminopimelate epimerase [Eubacteriales bacterium OttesenSCG-928-G02]|nr:diaminopimelate epimerase [Eubacteriales bacterium OttesenSCG-928-G02]
MKFTKMSAYGNDYVYIETFTQTINYPEKWARFVSDRHFGIGSDGMILLCPSDKAAFKMRVFNPDGSEAEMCGNALRSSAKLFYTNGFTKEKSFTVETLGGIKNITLEVADNEVVNITANVGAPILDYTNIPVTIFNNKNRLINYPVEIYDRTFELTAVSMGNPHCAIYCPDVKTLDLKKYGSAIENLDIFPEKTNVEFYDVIDRNTLFLRTWERNCGETLACGTGCCVSTISAYLSGRCNNKTRVIQLGGIIEIEYNIPKNEIIMTGKSEIIFEGQIDDQLIRGGI